MHNQVTIIHTTNQQQLNSPLSPEIIIVLHQGQTPSNLGVLVQKLKANYYSRINKANEIPIEIHHLERLKTQWKTDVIQQNQSQKIVQVGQNTKKILRLIYNLIYLPHQNLHLRSSKLKSNLQIIIQNKFFYFVPVYEKIIIEKKIHENYKKWFSYFLNILYKRSAIPSVKSFILNSIEISAQLKSHSMKRFYKSNYKGNSTFGVS
ncbi:unnamed protein product [Paramecium octaurelia]|uniref:Uncharacterized protein n=1 Tax=Paramecium octaurelia TaxID=43137 RepID=A0A8S1RZ81_PAROT|nr:unnamed protein product [Paramecium octaurelia]